MSLSATSAATSADPASRVARSMLAILALASPCAAANGSLAVGGRVLGASAQPRAGAAVELLAESCPGRGQVEAERAECAVAEGVTGPDGAFRLPVPEPGLWRVRVTAEGSPLMEHRLHPLFEDAQLAPLVLGRSLQPGDAPPAGDWRPAAPPRARRRGAPITVSGRVVEAPSGAPVAGALVWAPDDPGAVVGTAADGRFVAGLPPGESRFLRIAADGYLIADREVPPGSGDAGEIRLLPSAAVEGRVVDRTGRPVADAAVRMDFGAQAVRGLETFSRPDGRFLLGGLPPARPGELRAAIDAAGRRLAARHDLPALRPRERRQAVRLVLSGSPRVLGRVVAPNGSGVAGARLSLEAEPPSEAPRLRLDRQPAAAALSREDGRFELLDAGPGRFRLELVSPGFLPAALPGIELAEAGEDVDLGSLVLQAGAALSGRVVEEGGAAIPEARVEARWEGEGGPWRTESGADGGFTLADLPPGARLEVSVRHRGFAPAVLPEVEVSPEPLEVVLRPGASLSGRVVDGEGRGVGSAEVLATVSPAGSAVASGAASSETVAVEPDGRFELSPLHPGTVSLRATAPGYRAAELAGIEAASGASVADLELVLEEAAVLAGSVRAPDDSPLPGARVSVRSRDVEARVLGTAVAGADGAFRVEGLEPGPVEARADHPRFRRASRDLDLPLGESRVDLVLGQGLTVAGRVEDEAGGLVEGAEIGVEEIPGAPRSHFAVSLADGTFRLTGLEPGPLTLTVRREGFVPGRLALELGAESVEGVAVRLERGGAVAGRLLGLDAADLGRVEVVAFAPGQPGRAGGTRPGGRYRIEGLPPGEWTVVAAVAPGGRQARGVVRLAGGEEELDLEFGAGLWLSGRIRVGSRPLAGAEVTLLGLSGQGLAQARTGAAGDFELTGLAAGPYRLRFELPASGFSHERTLELTADRELALDLASSRVSGRVLSADGSSPVAGARVTLEPLAGGAEAAAVAVTDSTGFFLLPLVPEGEYRLTVEKPGFTPLDRSLSVAGGAPAELSLFLSRG